MRYYTLIASFFFISLATAQEVSIPSKFGFASSEASELMKKNNIAMTQECGNITVTIGGNTNTKLVATGNILIATTKGGKDLVVFSYQTYEDTVTVYSVNPKKQQFTVQPTPELKKLMFEDCNCEKQYQPRVQLQHLARYLQIADYGQWFDVHMLGGYEYWTVRLYEEEKKIKGFVKPRSMKCCSTNFTIQN